VLVSKEERKKANQGKRSLNFHGKAHNTAAVKFESIIYNDMATSMNGENIVQNSVHPSIQLLRSLGNLILVSMTAAQVCHHSSPSKTYTNHPDNQQQNK